MRGGSGMQEGLGQPRHPHLDQDGCTGLALTSTIPARAPAFPKNLGISLPAPSISHPTRSKNPKRIFEQPNCRTPFLRPIPAALLCSFFLGLSVCCFFLNHNKINKIWTLGKAEIPLFWQGSPAQAVTPTQSCWAGGPGSPASLGSYKKAGKGFFTGI